MARPKLEAGALGEISARQKETDGKKFWVAESSMRLEGGKKKRLSARGATKAAALAALHRKADKVRNESSPLGSATPTVRDALRYYLENLEVTDPRVDEAGSNHAVRRQSFEKYEADASHLNRIMGDVEIADLTVPLVQKRLESLMDRSTGKGAMRAQQAKGTLSRALDEAVRMGELAANPVLSVKLQRKGARVVEALGPEDLQVLRTILEARLTDKRRGMKPHPRILWTTELMLATGCRIGEVLAIRWQDVDLEAKTVVISGTILEKGGVYRQAYTKTGLFHSHMALTDKAVDALKAARSLIDDPIAPESPVFPTRSGRFSSPSAARRALRRVLEDSDVQLPVRVTPHAFRRAVATFLAENVGVEAAAAQLRHKSSRTTQAHRKFSSQVRPWGAKRPAFLHAPPALSVR